jgi:hypothetical protein
VLAAELALNDGIHGIALGGGGALPVDSKALVTDGALDVAAGGGLSKQDLHDASGPDAWSGISSPVRGEPHLHEEAITLTVWKDGGQYNRSASGLEARWGLVHSLLGMCNLLQNNELPICCLQVGNVFPTVSDDYRRNRFSDSKKWLYV